MVRVNITIRGDGLRRVSALPRRGREAAGNALPVAAEVYAAALRSLAPGSLRRHVRRSKANVGFDRLGSHAHLVEFGHRQVTESGEVVGRVAPRPFARPALRQSRRRMLQAASDYVRRELGVV